MALALSRALEHDFVGLRHPHAHGWLHKCVGRHHTGGSDVECPLASDG